jgi:hypothetical protein
MAAQHGRALVPEDVVMTVSPPTRALINSPPGDFLDFFGDHRV